MKHSLRTRRALNQQPLTICSSCLRHVLAQHRQQHQQRRHYIPAAERRASREYQLTDAQRKGPVRSIGIVGGGISGLATAYFLRERYRDSFLAVPSITIYETSKRLGGWLQTRKIELDDGHGYIRIEEGPRTLATSASGMLTMDLIHELGIADSVRYVKKTDPSAQNRYIYTGDEELKQVPTSTPAVIKDVLEEGSLLVPILAHVLRNLLRRVDAVPATSGASLGQVLAQVLGPATVHRLVSSFIHGIYAGDVFALSARAKGPWSGMVSRLQDGPVSLLQLMGGKQPVPDVEWQGSKPKWLQPFSESFVFYLKEGLGMLSLALESHLRMNDGTKILTNANVDKIAVSGDGMTIEYRDTDGTQVDQHDYVVSAVPPHIAHDVLHPSPPWRDVQAVSVGTVTFFWKDAEPVEYDGFGYVISQATPHEQNPYGALGVIFDSCTRPAQDTAKGQKITMLLGGEYWQPRIPSGSPRVVSEEDLIKQAEDTLKIQLGVTLKADKISVNIVEQCIPQPTIEFMHSVHSKANPAVAEWARQWNHRLLLTGPPVSGPGVHDCVRGAYQTAGRILSRDLDMLADRHDIESAADKDGSLDQQAAQEIESELRLRKTLPQRAEGDEAGHDVLWPNNLHWKDADLQSETEKIADGKR